MGFVIEADTDTDAAVQEQLDELDVFAFVSNSNLPTTEVTIYTDADAALKIEAILLKEQARAAEDNDSLSIADEDETDEEELTELHERLLASALTFDMQGLAPSAYDALEKSLRAKEEYKEGAANEEYNLALNNELVARSVRSVRSANGQTTSKKWTAAAVDKLTNNLYPSEANKLYIGAQKLTYIQNIFDSAVSADFS